MPSRSRVSGTRKRTPNRTRSLSLVDMADAMETPLNRAQDLVRALEYVGYGLSSLEDDSAPAIFSIAQALSENLETAKKSWQILFNASRA